MSAPSPTIERQLCSIEYADGLQQRLLESNRAGIAIYDVGQPDLPIVYVNPAFEQISGYLSPEILGQSYQVLQNADSDQSGLIELQKTTQNGEECRVLIRSYRKDGTLFWNDFSLSPLFNSNGHLTHFIGFIDDVTERVQADEHARNLQQDIERLNAIIEMQYQIALAERDFEHVLDLIIAGTQKLTGAEGVSIGLIEGEEIVYRVVPGSTHYETDLRVPRTSTLSGYCIAQEKLFECGDTYANPLEVLSVCRAIESRSIIMTPLRFRQEVVGVLAVSSPRAYAFNGRDVQTVELMAGLFGAAMRHSTEFDEKQALLAERTETLLALQRTEDRFRTFMNNSPAMAYVKDTEGRYDYINAKVELLFGVTQEDIQGQSDDDWLPAELARVIRANDQSVLQSNETIEFTEIFPTPDGTMHEWLSFKFPFNDVDGKRYLGGVSLDITERRAAEQKLQRILAQTKQLVGSISSILIGVDEDGRTMTWNNSAAKAFGRSAEDVIDQPFEASQIQWDYLPILEAMATCRRENRVVRVDDVRYVRADRSEGCLGITISPIVGQHENSQGLLLLAADISARKALERQLVQAQKLESIGQLAAGMAHEINTPIQYIGDNLRFLQDCFQDLEPIWDIFNKLVEAAQNSDLSERLTKELAGVIDRADLPYLRTETPQAIRQSLDGVERVSHIVKAMKEFSHPGSEAKTTVDLNRALENTITVACNEWKYVATVETALQPDLPLVPCFPGELNQVFLNMIVNAAHATGDGCGKLGIIRVSTRTIGSSVEIRISDTGCGIPEAIRSKIFDPFFTTKEVGKGTGQGLAIAHSIVVEKHGGTIDVESTVGVGTTFIIRLPLEPVKAM